MSDDDVKIRTFGRAGAKIRRTPSPAASPVQTELSADWMALALACPVSDRAALTAALRDTARNYLTAPAGSPAAALWSAAAANGWLERLDDIAHEAIQLQAFAIRAEGRPAIERLIAAWNDAAPLRLETAAEAYQRLCVPFVRDLQGASSEAPRDRHELMTLMAETMARLVEEAFSPREREGIVTELGRLALAACRAPAASRTRSD